MFQSTGIDSLNDQDEVQESSRTSDSDEYINTNSLVNWGKPWFDTWMGCIIISQKSPYVMWYPLLQAKLLMGMVKKSEGTVWKKHM